MKREVHKSIDRILCVSELATFHGTQFEDEFKMELARESVWNEICDWKSKEMISEDEFCNLILSVLKSKL